MTREGQRQLIRDARRLALRTRATLVRHVLIMVVVWLLFAVPWVLSGYAGTFGRLDRVALMMLAVVGLIVSAMWLIAHRSVIAKQIRTAYPIDRVVYSEVDDHRFRIATALGETSWRWDQLDGARSNSGAFSIPDRLAVRPDQPLPGLLPVMSAWVPRALVADDVFVRLGIPVDGTTPESAQHGYPRGIAVTQSRTWVVTADAQRRLARDAWWALILEPKIVVAEVLVAVAVAGQVAVEVLMILDGYGVRPTSLLLPVLLALNIWAPWWMAHRQVLTDFPVGFSASLQVEDVGLRVSTARDERMIPWSLLQHSRRRGTAFSYPNPVQSIARETIPAVLIPDDVLVRLGCRPRGTELVEA